MKSENNKIGKSISNVRIRPDFHFIDFLHLKSKKNRDQNLAFV